MKINKIIIFAVMLLIVSVSAFAETFTDSGKLTMSFTLKDFATVTTAPAAVDNLEYNGTSQDLVTAGTPNGGTMVYALGTSEAASEDYSVSIPTGFDEGTYYVWYKVSADADHRDSAALSLDVTITLTSYTISYDLNGANEPGNPTSYTMKSSDITLINPAKNGYTFRGWTGTELTELSTDVTIPGGSSGDRSYTANWQKITYIISFDANGGNFEEGQNNPTSYDVESEFSTIAPTREGYDFEGWLLSGDTSGTVSSDLTIPTGTIGNREYIAQWTLHVYTLSYDIQSGTVSPDNPTSYTIESDDIKLYNPTKTGYTFDGWTGTSVDVTSSKDVTISHGSTGDRSYTANYTLNVYTLSYDLDGGTASPDNPVIYTFESNDITLYNPTKTGYTFAGWTGTSVDVTSSMDVTIAHNSTDDRSYTANWILNVYTLSYDLQDGTISPDNPVNYTFESEDIKLENPTKTGYTFMGWTGTGLTEASTDLTIPTGSAGDRSYTATWTATVYTISYTLNNGSVTGNPASYTIESSDDITLNNPTRNGYTFDGWTGTDLSGKTQKVIIQAGSIGNRSYTANWTPITYTITYELNNGTLSSENPASYTIETATFTLNNPTKTGYTFAGWTGTGLTEATETVTITVNSTGNRSYTANWTLIEYDIDFDLGGGVFADENPTSYNYETQTFTLNNPTKEGYEFLGWSVEGEEGLLSEVEISEGTTGDRKYIANWKVSEYTISYELNGGTVTPENPVMYTIESDDFTITNPTKDGYEFAGWTGTNVDDTTSKDVTISTGSTGNREYTANWTLSVYTLSYDLDGGTVSTDNPTSYSIESDDFTLTNPIKNGYEFAGWSGTNVDDTMSKDVTISTGSTGNREYTANWAENVLPESSDVLQSIIVEISGDETLTINAGISASITFTVNVQGIYSGEQIIELSSDNYVLTWAMNDVEGFSLTDGTLTVNESTSAGIHEIEITATAASGDVSGSDTKKVTVNVINAASVPILTCSTPNITVKKGETIADLTVNANVTPQDWLTNGELPEGLTYRIDGNNFVISGTVSSNVETKAYVYTIQARNEIGISEAMTITITVTSSGSETQNTVQVPAEEISNMTDEEITETIGNNTNVTLTGNVENLAETIKRIETLTDVKTLDLSQVTGVSELKLENTTLESITLEGNQSITKVEINGNETLTALNLGGSKVETVDAEGCEKLTSINLEGAENLTSLNVKETNITTLNVKDCAKLEMVDAKGCEELESVNLEGCESLEYLDVSETKITELDVHGCINLGTLNCYSCDIENINLEGCEKLDTLDCSYNSFLTFDAVGLTNLHHLECRHQRVYNKPLARLMNFLDLLLGRGAFSSSVADENDSAILSNVENLKAYDATGQELAVEFDRESGEVMFSGEPAKIGYDYVTGFNGMMMDVEVYPSENQTEESGSLNVLGPSSGGCTSGFEMGALGVLVLLMTLPRKKATE